MANTSRKIRQRSAAEKAGTRRASAPPEHPRWLPAHPRPPRPWLLALAVVLFGLWLILLLLLAVLA